MYVKCLEQSLAHTKYYVSVCCYQLLYEILCLHDLVKSFLCYKVFANHPLSPRYRANLISPFSKPSLYLNMPLPSHLLVLYNKCFFTCLCPATLSASWKTMSYWFCGPSSWHGAWHIEDHGSFFWMTKWLVFWFWFLAAPCGMLNDQMN